LFCGIKDHWDDVIQPLPTNNDDLSAITGMWPVMDQITSPLLCPRSGHMSHYEPQFISHVAFCSSLPKK
jgi:hypothetical protein